jgi:hypothetical protein
MDALYKSTLSRPILWVFMVPVILILNGCATVGPDYVPPDTSVPATYHSELKGGLNS